MKQQVLRKTLTGGWTEFAFANNARRFFVKNFTAGNIFVSFENGTAENQSFKIANGVGEEVAISYAEAGKNPFAYFVNKIYVKGTGEVEVQQIDVNL